LHFVLLHGQYEAWSVGRLGRYEKGGGGEDAQDEDKEAEIKIVENCLCSAIVVLYV